MLNSVTYTHLLHWPQKEHEIEKIAISDELKYKAMIERSARGLASGKTPSELTNVPFSDLAFQKKPGVIGPQSYLSKKEFNTTANHKFISKYDVWDEISRAYPIKGPNIHKKLENSYIQKTKAIPSYINDTVGKDIKQRATEISDNASVALRRRSFLDKPSYVANDNIQKLPAPIVENINKSIPKTTKLKTLGKGALIGATGLGLGYLAHKAFSKPSQDYIKSAQEKGAFINPLSAIKPITGNLARTAYGGAKNLLKDSWRGLSGVDKTLTVGLPLATTVPGLFNKKDQMGQSRANRIAGTTGNVVGGVVGTGLGNQLAKKITTKLPGFAGKTLGLGASIAGGLSGSLLGEAAAKTPFKPFNNSPTQSYNTQASPDVPQMSMPGKTVS